MKKLFFTLLTSISLFSFAQVPQEISYQGVARNTIGTVLSNQNISIKLDLHQGSASGTVVFSESHNKTTNAFGLFTLGIGSVNNSAFSSINWANGPYFLEVSMDPLGGTSYTAVGIQQFMSVPYALYAQTSGNASTTPTITINAPNTVTSAGGSYTINVPSSATYTAGSGININSGVISGTANIIGSGATTVTGTYPNLTINTPTVVSDQTVSITGINSATVTGTYPNFTVNVPSGSSLPNALSGQFLYHTGTIWDTLPRNNLYFDGTNFGIGTTNPQANFHVVGAGKFDASVSTPHVFTNTLSVSGGTLGQVLTSDASGNGTFQNLPVAQTPTITSTGIAVVTPTTGNTFNVSVPQPTLSYNNATNVLSLTHDGTTVSTATLVGTGTNTTSIVGTGLATVTPTTGSTFTVSVPNPTLSVASGSISISGGNSVPIPTTSVVSTNTNISVSSSAGVYSLTAVSPSISGTGVIGSYPNYTINSTPNQTLSINSGSLSISGGNTVPIPTTSVVSTNTNISVTSSAGVFSLTAVSSNLSGDVIGSVNSTTVTQLQTRPVSNAAPTANQVLTWNGSAWTPSSTVVPVLSYTGSTTASTLQSGAQTVTIPNYTLSNTSNTITLNNGTANSTAIIPVPTLTLSGTTLQSGPATNTVSLSGLGGIYSGSGSIQTGSTTVTVGTNTLTFLSGNTNKPIANFFGGGFTGSFINVGHVSTNGTGIKFVGSATTTPVSYGQINANSSNGVTIIGGASSSGIYATGNDEVGVGTFTTGTGKFVVTHAATQANPTMHLRETSGALSRIKFSNTSVLNRFFEAGASVNAADNFSAYSISFHDGTNYKSRFLIYGDGKTSINNMHTALTTFHVMDDNATSPGIATEGFGFAGQMNLTRNNPLGVSPTYTRGAVFGGQEIGKINFAAHDGTNYGDGAKIYAKTTENVTTGTRGTELIFAAVPTGTNSNKDAFKINGAGNLEVISGLRIPLGSVSGHVLTSDAIGNASWQPITSPALAWVSSAGTTTLVNNTDKVGIGTNTPSESLDVNGNINVPNTTASSGIFKMGGLNFIHAFSSNLFFGIAAGNTSLSGFNNVGIGQVTLQSITTGANNVGLGYQVMQVLTQGSQNIAIGTNALSSMSNGNNNTALGFQAGNIITNGSNNLFLGYNTNANTSSLTNASAIGALARVDASNSMILGSINGINGATASTKVGIGTTTPQSILEIVTDGSLTNGLRLGNNAATNGPSIYLDGQAQDWTITGSNSGNGSGANKLVFRDYTNAVDRMVIDNTGKVGIGTTAPLAYMDVVSNSNTIAINASSSGTLETFTAKNTNALATAYAGVFEGGLTTKGKSNTFNDYAFRAFNLAGTSLLSIRDDAIAEFGSNVGINVLNPANRLHVNSSFTNAAILAENIVTGSFANAHGIYAKVSSSNTSTQASALYAENLGAGAAVRAVNGPTVTGGSNVALLLENGHMKSVGTTPTFTLNALASGTGVIGTDMVGKLSFTVLLSAILSNTDVITVKFDKPYSTIPNIIIIPNNGSSYAVNAYVNAATVNGFSLRFANNSGISTTYSFNYLVIE